MYIIVSNAYTVEHMYGIMNKHQLIQFLHATLFALPIILTMFYMQRETTKYIK